MPLRGLGGSGWRLPGRSCKRHCYRRSFAGEPVRIADLLRWVDRAVAAA
ncbi:MAG: hypothetical protein NT169_25240 [Chloroflexi bacterium]|nr:hypothetical protein [Chloroflexota bacterium]